MAGIAGFSDNNNSLRKEGKYPRLSGYLEHFAGIDGKLPR